MRFVAFAEKVAHYMDESEVENHDFFFTVTGGVLCEIAERFPEVKSVSVTCLGNSQTLVKMRELVNDFASFSFPPVRVDGVYLPDGCPTVDARLGEILIPAGFSGEVDIFYNRSIQRLDRDDYEMDVEIPLEEEKAELAVLLAAYRLLIIDEDKKASAIKMLYDEAAYRLENRDKGVYSGFRSTDGWA